MTPRQKKRMGLVALMLIGVSVAVTLLLVALNDNLDHFYTPTQLAQEPPKAGTSIKVGGMVVDGSVVRNSEDLKVKFDITDTAHAITVEFDGILPDLFREGQGIVTIGKMENGLFNAQKVLAKHDENYMSPEVKAALDAAKANAGTSTDASANPNSSY